MNAARDLADQFAGDLAFPRRQLPTLNQPQQIAQRHPPQLVDRPVAEADGGSIVPQAAAAARRAVDFVDELLQPGAERGRQAGGFFQGRIQALELKAEAGEGRRRWSWRRGGRAAPSLGRRGVNAAGGRGSNRHGGDLEPLLARAVHQDPPVTRPQLVERAVQRHARAGRQAVQHRPGHAVLERRPQGDGAVGQRPLGVAEQRRGVRADLHSQPLARLAPAQGTVEGKAVRRQRLKTASAAFAGQVLAVRADRPTGLGHVVQDLCDADHTFAQRQRILDAVGNPRPGVGADDDPIDDDFDVVLATAVNLGRRLERVRDAVDADPDVASRADFVPQRLVLAADLDLDRGHHVQPRACRLGHDLVHDLVDRLGADGHIAIGTVSLAQTRQQDPQVVVDLRHRADGRARRIAQVLLLDRNRRRQAVNVIDLRLLHLADELAGVRAEALDVTPLTLGVDRVHGQRTLARAARAAEHGHRVAANAGVHVLQVVLMSALDGDLLGQRAGSAMPPIRPARGGPGGGLATFVAHAVAGLVALRRRQQGRQGSAGVGIRTGGQLLRRAARHNPPAAVAALGPQVDDPVGRLDHVQVVFDDQHRVAGVDKVVQDLEQQLDIGKMQARRRLVQQVQRPAGAAFDQLARQLDPLGLATGQRRRRLAQLHIVQAHVVQRLQLVAHVRNVLEQVQRLLDVHLQHFCDRAVLELDLQRLTVVAVAFAHRAGDPDVGQKVHLQPRAAVAFAGLAAAAGDIEAEPARLVPPPLGLRHLGEQVADLVEDLDVRARIGPWRAADRRLVDRDHLVQQRQAFDGLVSTRLALAPIEVSPQGFDQDVVDQRTLARARDASNTDEQAQRDLGVDVLQVVVRCAQHAQSRLAHRAALRRHVDRLPAGQVLAGNAAFCGQHLVVRAGHDDFAAPHAGAGSEVDDVIGGPHRVLVVLDHQHRIAHVPQPLEGRQQTVVIPRVQADGRFVQDVQHADQPAPDLAGQADSLRLAAGQRRGGPAQGQVVQPHIQQEPQPPSDFLEDFAGNQRARLVQLQRAEEVRRVADRQIADVRQRQPNVAKPGMRAAHLDGSGLRIQA